MTVAAGQEHPAACTVLKQSSSLLLSQLPQHHISPMSMVLTWTLALAHQPSPPMPFKVGEGFGKLQSHLPLLNCAVDQIYVDTKLFSAAL